MDFEGDIRNSHKISIYRLKGVTKVRPSLSQDDTETLMHANYHLSRLRQCTLC